MSRFILTTAAAAAVVVAIATPANARDFDGHFSVISEDVAGHETANGFAFRSVLLNPANLNNRVGTSHVKCRVGGGKSRCKALIHLDGSIGGFGNLLVKGNFGRGDTTLNVVDGDGAFSGAVAGKMTIHGIDRNTERLRFALTR